MADAPDHCLPDRQLVSAVLALQQAFGLLVRGNPAEAQEVIADWLIGNGKMEDPSCLTLVTEAFAEASGRARTALCRLGLCPFPKHQQPRLKGKMRRRPYWPSWREEPCAANATIGMLSRCSRNDILSVKNCGEKTVAEIEAVLARMGLALRSPK